MQPDSLPLVTALCLTRQRKHWLPQAVDCFNLQTYPNKELLVLGDSREDLEGLKFPPGSQVKYTDGARLVVGAKRNVGCQAARGEIIAIWDDDDYSAPARLSQQVEVLNTSAKSVTGYREMKFTDGKEWWRYPGPGKDFVLATSLCFRKEWWMKHRFAEIQCGQDEQFAAEAGRLGQLVECPDMDLMYATIHPGNTSVRQLNGGPWLKIPAGFQWKKQQGEQAREEQAA